MVHDWLHARAAKLAGADVVLTRDRALSRLCAAEARCALGTEALTLERALSDLADHAYGLTPAEIALMWRTAPPRMPFPRAGT